MRSSILFVSCCLFFFTVSAVVAQVTLTENPDTGFLKAMFTDSAKPADSLTFPASHRITPSVVTWHQPHTDAYIITFSNTAGPSSHYLPCLETIFTNKNQLPNSQLIFQTDEPNFDLSRIYENIHPSPQLSSNKQWLLVTRE